MDEDDLWIVEDVRIDADGGATFVVRHVELPPGVEPPAAAMDSARLAIDHVERLRGQGFTGPIRQEIGPPLKIPQQ